VPLLLIERKLHSVLSAIALNDHRNTSAVLTAEIGLQLPRTVKRLSVHGQDAVSLPEASLSREAALLHTGDGQTVLCLFKLEAQPLSLARLAGLLSGLLGACLV